MRRISRIVNGYAILVLLGFFCRNLYIVVLVEEPTTIMKFWQRLSEIIFILVVYGEIGHKSIMAMSVSFPLRIVNRAVSFLDKASLNVV